MGGGDWRDDMVLWEGKGNFVVDTLRSCQAQVNCQRPAQATVGFMRGAVGQQE